MRWVVVSAICAMLVAGCGGDENGGTSARGAGPNTIPTVEDALQGPGTALGDGLSVPEGSWLVGDAFPDPGGWTAVLVLGDDPLQAFGAQLRQVQAAGFTSFVVLGSSVCTAETARPEQRTTEFVDLAAAPAMADHVRCAITAVRPTSDGQADTASLEMFLGLPYSCATACTQSYARHLEISFVRSDGLASSYLNVGGGRPDPPDVGALALPLLPRPASGLRLPEAGERVGLDQAFFDGFAVEDGSAVLAPGTGLDTAGTGDYTVLLRVDGDSRSILEAYGRQFQRLCCARERFELTEQAIPNGTRLVGGVAESGGITVSLTTNRLDDGEPVFVRVNIEND